MRRDLSAAEARVLGCLLEKQRTTPEQYPLTLNALRLACNQSTNRDPGAGGHRLHARGTVAAFRHLVERGGGDPLARRRLASLRSLRRAVRHPAKK